MATLMALYVVIPYPRLRAALQSQYPACFNNSEELDTSCTAIVQAMIQSGTLQQHRHKRDACSSAILGKFSRLYETIYLVLYTSYFTPL